MTGEVEEAVWRRPVALPMVDYMGNWALKVSRGVVQAACWQGRTGQGVYARQIGWLWTSIRRKPTGRA